ncbi:hypothetical protein [Bacillus mobilis]|uniref:hypothetical protein n=1 Tax=Bacillus TaxID=1386 RepID=UPI002E1CE8FA|nr:hypothetical protein [Bacillus mobilis]MED0957974.1 hypothetical protein [Bacillus mobilis]
MALTCSNFNYFNGAIGQTGGSICVNPGSTNVAASVYWKGSAVAVDFPFTLHLQKVNANEAWVTFASRSGNAKGGGTAHVNFTNIGAYGQGLRALLVDGAGKQAGSHIFIR